MTRRESCADLTPLGPLMRDAVAGGTAENAKTKLARVLSCFSTTAVVYARRALEPCLAAFSVWSLRAPVGYVIVHTKRVYRATPPPAAYTERPIRVAWNTSKGWRGGPNPLGYTIGPPSPAHNTRVPLGSRASCRGTRRWESRLRICPVTVLSLVEAVYTRPTSSPSYKPLVRLSRLWQPRDSAPQFTLNCDKAHIFPWGPRLSPTQA